MTCGIYLLRFKGTNKVYIGQSKLLETRLVRHEGKVRNHTASKKVLEAYDKYGYPTLEVIMECSEEELNSCENSAIEIWDAVNNGFNTCERAEDMPFPNNAGHLHPLSKYTNNQILAAFNYLIDRPELTQKEIGQLTGVSESVVNSIAYGGRHLWLQKEYPDRYIKLLSLKGIRKTTANRGEVRQLVSPTGEVLQITNVREFSRLNGLDQGHVGKVLKGIRLSHKGWTLFKDKNCTSSI